uniref:uncharacterized protein LOC120328160 isoform X1 n=2 Tax=Styela clava TaxID=7725 RepID=UPI00193A87AD|nr:uncharacterized protein LOC120328160 isoform X1 [Styela clava]
MMLHMYVVILAVVLLVGALAAIVICICVDIVPIIKSRGSTLVSRDSVTQEQTRMLKKSLQRSKLTSSASADFVESMKGRKTLAQALRKAERPRFGSTPLSLLTGDEDTKPEVEYKTTTVIIEALPKKTIAESNNNNDVTKINSDVTSEQSGDMNIKSPAKTTSPFSLRKQNIYTDEKQLNNLEKTENQLQKTKYNSSPNVSVVSRRTKSADLLDSDITIDILKGSMTYNARDVIQDEETQPRSYPNSPNIRTSRSMPLKQDNLGENPRRESPLVDKVADITRRGSPMRDCVESPHNEIVMSARKVPTSQSSVRSKHRYMQYGRPPVNPGDFPTDNRGFPTDRRFTNNINEYSPNRGNSPTQSCSAQHCTWCQMEQERSVHQRHLPFRRTESFPENYHVTSSPRLAPKRLPHQHSFDEGEAIKISRGFPYDRNKYCKNPHRGYSPCPDCFHRNHPAYYPMTFHGESPDVIQQERLLMMGNSPITTNTPIPVNPSTSSSSSTSSSGSSSRFRHIRQPLEDIQEDASDCYVIRDITSTIDSRELNSNDDTMPKSTDDNSIMSVSPILSPDKPPTFVSVSGS